MDLFDKCKQYERVKILKEMKLFPYFQEIEENNCTEVKIDGRMVIMAGSNNYLGLTKHPEVLAAAHKAMDDFGTSCSGSRFLNGNLVLHRELEEELADFLGVESSLVFTTGFLTNQGIIPTIVNRDECVISDKENHASIVAGTLIARAMASHVKRYANNDMESLKKLLLQLPPAAPKLLVSDGVFSMSGAVVDLPRLVQLAHGHNARVMIDEAHSIGVLGDGGRGVSSHFGMQNGRDVDLVMGTFSKSFASLGGFVAGGKEVVDYIKYNSQALIFSASMPPANVAAARTALRIIRREPERVQRLHDNAGYMRRGFRELGYQIPDDPTPIIPILIGDNMKTFRFCHRLLEEGVFANPVVSPAVPEGKQLIRSFFMATHEKRQLDRVLEVFGLVGREFGLLN
ncbi:MAG: aminotransferase class I/II-fold pyridoxal phosphate-dependent enzyme [Acidobacteriota bacterium]|nr:aminotransferase class I/II-fold pyridoxal phosphate-dependent enzyme [Acidobacteriota bacterium]